MIKQTKDSLTRSIDDLDCQIEYLKRAIKLELLDEEEEYRLNSLIVRKACFKKELENMNDENKICSIISKINYFPHKAKKISDYFSH